MWESLKNVPLKKRVIVRTNLFELILEITLFLSGTFFKESCNLYPRRGRGSLTKSIPSDNFGVKNQSYPVDFYLRRSTQVFDSSESRCCLTKLNPAKLISAIALMVCSKYTGKSGNQSCQSKIAIISIMASKYSSHLRHSLSCHYNQLNMITKAGYR